MLSNKHNIIQALYILHCSRMSNYCMLSRWTDVLSIFKREPQQYCNGWLLVSYSNTGVSTGCGGELLSFSVWTYALSTFIQYSPKSFFRLFRSPEWVRNTLAENIVIFENDNNNNSAWNTENHCYHHNGSSY